MTHRFKAASRFRCTRGLICVLKTITSALQAAAACETISTCPLPKKVAGLIEEILNVSVPTVSSPIFATRFFSSPCATSVCKILSLSLCVSIVKMSNAFFVGSMSSCKIDSVY